MSSVKGVTFSIFCSFLSFSNITGNYYYSNWRNDLPGLSFASHSAFVLVKCIFIQALTYCHIKDLDWMRLLWVNVMMDVIGGFFAFSRWHYTRGWIHSFLIWGPSPTVSQYIWIYTWSCPHVIFDVSDRDTERITTTWLYRGTQPKYRYLHMV